MSAGSARHGVVVALGLLAACVIPSAWSQDGGRIVFVGIQADGRTDIYFTTAEGVRFEALTAGDARESYFSDPAWSGDGRSLAFAHSDGVTRPRIYRMDADGLDRAPVSDGPGDFNPTWSPRGDQVAFRSARGGSDRQGIYLADINGGGDAPLTNVPEWPLTAWSGAPSWRPVGDVIAYAPYDNGSRGIHIMDSRGRHLAQLTDGRHWEGDPSWHPLGTAIAFASERDDNGDDADGSDARRVTWHPTGDWDPCWSPDGKELLFMSERDGGHALFITDVAGRTVRRLTTDRFIGVSGADWFDADFPRSVSPVDRHASTWGWLKRLGAATR